MITPIEALSVEAVTRSVPDGALPAGRMPAPSEKGRRGPAARLALPTTRAGLALGRSGPRETPMTPRHSLSKDKVRVLLLEGISQTAADLFAQAPWLGWVALALLGFSLVKHLRRARENAEKGVFGPPES